MASRKIHAPTGTDITCKGWHQEAAMRMLMNNLDPAVAEKPDELIVYGGSGKAARNWDCYDGIVRALKDLESDETLLVQSGKAVGKVRTHSMAPRVLISNAMLVPAWGDWQTFRDLEAKGLTMYGQMTAGSWIYIGTQGILQGTYETFAEVARQHFNDDLSGKLVLSAGLGGMGGAQPLSVTMNNGVFIGVEVDRERIQKRIETKYVQKSTDKLDEAISWALEAKEKGVALSIALEGNAAQVYAELLDRGVIPDVVTDQTSAHDLLQGYVPDGMSIKAANELREKDPDKYLNKSKETVYRHVEAMLGLQKKGAVVFDYGNNIRKQAELAGLKGAFDFPGFVPAYIRPLFCEGKGPFRWAALSGDPADIKATDEALIEAFPEDKALIRWLKLAGEQIAFQGMPCRICWLGYGARAKAGEIFHRLVRDKKVKAPIVIGRDHLDCGSVASPYRETEAMKDGSDAIADWPILNALANAVSGASWVSVHHGGGVGIGYSLHAGMVVVVDGTDEGAERLQRVLTTDPATGIFRHADAGYEKAIEVGKENEMLLE